MAVRQTIVGISSPRELEEALRAAYYLADDELSTAAYLALALGKPLLLEGAPGVGKTEAAKAIAGVLGRSLLRLQCYEGVDAAAALYEWNFPRQMLALRQAGAYGDTIDIYRDEFLIERPMLACLRRAHETMLLMDEMNRSAPSWSAKRSCWIFCPTPDLHTRAWRDKGIRAAGRHPHLQPHPRAARGAPPPLRLSLDRVSIGRAGNAHHHDARLRCQRTGGTRRGRRRRALASRAAGQASRH